MKKIFIDANIYVNFFDSNQSRLKKLLGSLVEIKDVIFISSQIADEVNRNKLDAAQRSLGNYLNNLEDIKKNNKPITLPEHLEIESTTLKTWNDEKNKIYEKISQENEKLYKQLENIIKKMLNEIMRSSDNVSQTFDLLFKDAVVASENEVKAGRDRREVGNPPGKPKDPLGDQISWEQFLNCSRDSENIWIISKDKDYYTSFKSEIYLNSFLYKELVSANTNSNPSIFCFESLAEGLDHFNKISSQKISNLPQEEELKIIAKEELSNSTSQIKPFSIDLPPGYPSPSAYFKYLQSCDPFEWFVRD